MKFSLLILALVALGVAGCNLLGVVAYKSLPPPRIPAAHALAEVPTAVVVRSEALISGEQGPMDAETVAITLKRALAERAEVEVVEAGQAQQRVEVDLDPPSAEGAMGSEFEQGAARARVRVVDAGGEEIWPDDGSPGYMVATTTPRVRAAAPADLRRATLRALAEQVAGLFHSREMEPGE
jgi:hypothetical protein